jgi:hypothetical protein
VAQQVFPSSPAARKKHRQSSDGTPISIRLYWMWREGQEYQQTKSSVRRTARKSRWCVVEHRAIDWASCSPFRGSLNQCRLCQVLFEHTLACTRRRAPFRSIRKSAIPNQELASQSFSSGTRSDPSVSSVRYCDHDYCCSKSARMVSVGVLHSGSPRNR